MPAPGRHFDDWIKEYIAYSAESEAPDKFHYWSAVSVIAGALRRRVHINMGYFQWVPNFYIIFVAPPGIVSKSTTAQIGMSLLREVPGIKFGPDVVTWQALANSLANASELFQLPDGTMFPMSAITIVSGELGTFFNPHDREMVDLLVALWDGQVGTFSKATKTQGNDTIQNPWVNLLGCTTPAWIAGNFPEYLIGGGFTSRCIFVFSDIKRHLNAYPFMGLPTTFNGTQKKLVEDLGIIASLAGEYKLTKAALDFGIKWYAAHYATRPPWLDNDRFGGYLARKQTHIHKLAMIIAASKSNLLEITEADLDLAIKVIGTIEADMPKVFANIGRTQQSMAVMDIVQIIKAHKSVDLQTLFRHCVRTMGKRDFEEALSAASTAGYVTVAQTPTSRIVTYTGDPSWQATQPTLQAATSPLAPVTAVASSSPTPAPITPSTEAES